MGRDDARAKRLRRAQLERAARFLATEQRQPAAEDRRLPRQAPLIDQPAAESACDSVGLAKIIMSPPGCCFAAAITETMLSPAIVT